MGSGDSNISFDLSGASIATMEPWRIWADARSIGIDPSDSLDVIKFKTNAARHALIAAVPANSPERPS